jgi:hypothetical protein
MAIEKRIINVNQDREVRTATGLNIKIPLDLSMQLSKRICDLRQSGSDITKSDLILKYAKEGLQQDQDGQSEPIQTK